MRPYSVRFLLLPFQHASASQSIGNYQDHFLTKLAKKWKTGKKRPAKPGWGRAKRAPRFVDEAFFFVRFPFFFKFCQKMVLIVSYTKAPAWHCWGALTSLPLSVETVEPQFATLDGKTRHLRQPLLFGSLFFLFWGLIFRFSCELCQKHCQKSTFSTPPEAGNRPRAFADSNLDMVETNN